MLINSLALRGFCAVFLRFLRGTVDCAALFLRKKYQSLSVAALLLVGFVLSLLDRSAHEVLKGFVAGCLRVLSWQSLLKRLMALRLVRRVGIFSYLNSIKETNFIQPKIEECVW